MVQIDIYGNLNSIKPKPIKKESKLIEKETDSEPTSKILANITTYATFKPHSITISDKYSSVNQNPKSLDNLLQETDRQGDYNGYLSANTKREIKRRLDNWLTSITENVNLSTVPKQASPETVYPTFVTLTLPSKQLHSDQKIKNEVFDPFLEWLTSKNTEINKKGVPKGCAVCCYFWRAESQKNGNLHFHLIVDKWIHHKAIRSKWNQFCERLGYVTRYTQLQKKIYQNGFVLNQKQQTFEVKRLRPIAEKFNETKKLPKRCNVRLMDELKECQRLNRTISEESLYKVAENIQSDAYFNGLFEDWKNPNSTDIKKVDNIKSLASYVCKYVAKDCETEPLKENQKLETVEGKKYVVTTTNDDGYIFHTSEPYKPIFLSRKVRGRIWGCSDSLKQKDENKKEVVSYMKFEVQESVIVIDSDPKAVKRCYRSNVYENQNIIDCLQSVKCEKKIEKREHSEYCYSYTSKDKIKTFLTAELKNSYQTHYRNLFNILYAKT